MRREKRKVYVRVGVCVSRKVRVHQAARAESAGLRLQLQSAVYLPVAAASDFAVTSLGVLQLAALLQYFHAANPRN